MIFWNNSLPITILLNVSIIGCLLIDKIDKRLWVLIIFLGGLTVYNKDALALLDVLTLAYIVREISLETLAKLNLAFFLLFLIAWYFGVDSGRIEDEQELGFKGYVHYFGFNNPNVVGMQGFTLICSLFLLCKSILSKIGLMLLIPFVNQFFYSYSLARTPWLAGYIVLLCMMVQLFYHLKPKMRYWVALLPFFVLSLIAYAAINANALWQLNALTSGRIRYAGELLMQMTPLKFLIGTSIPEDLIIDNSYIMILCDGGIFSLIYFLIGYYKNIVRKWTHLQQYIPFIIATIAIGVTENSFASVSGLTVMFWSMIFYKYSSITVITKHSTSNESIDSYSYT